MFDFDVLLLVLIERFFVDFELVMIEVDMVLCFFKLLNWLVCDIIDVDMVDCVL